MGRSASVRKLASDERGLSPGAEPPSGKDGGPAGPSQSANLAPDQAPAAESRPNGNGSEAPQKAKPARAPRAKAKTAAPRKKAEKPSVSAKAPTATPAKPRVRRTANAKATPPVAALKAPAPAEPRASEAPAKPALDAAAAGIARPAAETARPADPAPKPAESPRATEHPFLTPEVEAFAFNAARFWEESGKAMSAYMRPREQGARGAPPEVTDIVKTLGQVTERWISDPQRAAEAQRAFATGFLDLWSGTLRRLSGEKATAPVIQADPRDARFKDPDWTEHPIFDFIKQAYLHASGWADKMVAEADDLDEHTRHKAAFYVRLITAALSPSNFLPTNPELIRETLAQKGENLVRGMKMLAEDIDFGKGDLRIRQTDPTGFEVGKNIAVSPGKVVFRNELIELIQYAPSTEMVRTRPLLIVPPWINKFYILDLNPEKSMIKWLVDQEMTVFVISWVNPDARHASKSFDDYMRDGILAAVDVANDICGSTQVDTAAYCVGGTLLSVTMAYLAATGDNRIASATLFAAQVDFTHAGDLKVFVDEEQISAVEARMKETGYLDGSRMANAFNMLRSNDLIWPYVVNNYLKGKAATPFDLLYWNSDATRMPAANHSFYLRHCYLNNDLSQGRMEILGKHLDVGKIKSPIYCVAPKEDHIAPAKSVFLGAQFFGGPVRFVLTGSGHIAGVVNPPKKMKYQYWIGPQPSGELEDWVKVAEEKPGSWWPDWRAWFASLDATMAPARIPGEGKHKALEDAPGSYVKIRA